MSTKHTDDGFITPGISSGLLEVFKKPYLLSLIVHKELRARYRGSVLGMLWSYAKPLTQFSVFYFAIGVFMRMNQAIPNYVIYMFSGVVMVNYFNEILWNATRNVVGNAPLVKKIYLPRQLFPVSSVWVALVHFLPQLIILMFGALLFGWHPTLVGMAAIIAAFIIVTLFALGVGLFCGAINVFYRDSENFVDLLLMVVTWVSPVLYSWQMVHEALIRNGLQWGWWLYQLNPMTVAIELFHYGFWQHTTMNEAVSALPANGLLWVGLAFAMAVMSVVVGDAYFRRVEYRFAQEM